MELLSISTPSSPHSLSSSISLGSLKFRSSLSTAPSFSLRPYTAASPSLKCSLGSHQIPSPIIPTTLGGGPRIDNEEEPNHSIHLSAQQMPAATTRGGDGDVMGMLLRERIVFLGSSIDDFVADAIISQLLLLDAQDPTKDIRLFVNSSGGSLSATLAIYDVVQLLRCDVSTVCLGIAASTAALILGGGTKGKRLAMPNTRIMIHQPLGGASGQAMDVEIQAREVMHNKNNITSIISGFTGRTFEQVVKDIDRDRYMSPIEAVEYGIIDGVIDRDSIIPLQPVPDKVKSRLNYEEISKDPRKFLTPEIPDDEIY